MSIFHPGTFDPDTCIFHPEMSIFHPGTFDPDTCIFHPEMSIFHPGTFDPDTCIFHPEMSIFHPGTFDPDTCIFHRRNFHPEFSPGIFTLRCLGIFTPYFTPWEFSPRILHPGNFHPVFFTLGLFTLEDTVPCKKHINGSTHETGVWGHHAPMNACCILMNRRTDTEGLFSSHTSHNS